jgi:hypothetical protein
VFSFHLVQKFQDLAFVQTADAAVSPRESCNAATETH